jgi:hypothetical protein
MGGTLKALMQASLREIVCLTVPPKPAEEPFLPNLWCTFFFNIVHRRFSFSVSLLFSARFIRVIFLGLVRVIFLGLVRAIFLGLVRVIFLVEFGSRNVIFFVAVDAVKPPLVGECGSVS